MKWILKDLTGRVFGRLTVLSRAPNIKQWTRWSCRCECGTVVDTYSTSLLRGLTQSCGCLQRERTSISGKTSNLKHGFYNHPLYGVWDGMMRRCYKPATANYRNYGGRGIAVCDDWHSPEKFVTWGIASGYTKGLSLDRYPDNNGNYEPGNCRWATMKQQLRNKRSNVFLEWDGQRRTVSEWAEVTGLRFHVIRSRMHRGWSTEDVLTRPLQLHQLRATSSA